MSEAYYFEAIWHVVYYECELRSQPASQPAKWANCYRYTIAFFQSLFCGNDMQN